MVNIKIDPQTNEWWFEPEFLVYSEKEQEDGSVARIYFVDNPASDGNPLIFLSFVDEKEVVMIDDGFLTCEGIQISQRPFVYDIRTIFVLETWRGASTAFSVK